MLKKLLAALGALALVAGLVALVAGPASAHIPTINATCAAGVSVNLTYYNKSNPNDLNNPTPNHVTVTMDGTIRESQSFGTTFIKTYAWSPSAPTHTWEVVVTAWDDPTGSKGWSVDQKGTVTGCETSITPAVATSTNPYCTAAGVVGGGGYTIPASQTGVKYQLWDGSKWVDVLAGTFSANPGAVIKIQAIATAGYTFTAGSTTSWTFTLTSPDASKCVVPTPPTANPAECITATPGSSTTATYTVPKAPAGYSYFVNGSTTPTSDTTVNVTTFPTTIVIAATANTGYTFPASTVTSWTFDFASPGDCHATVTPAAVTAQQATCTGPGTTSHNGYTVTAVTGVIYQLKTGSTWTTITSYGFHDLGTGASSVEIRAIAEPHYVLTGTTDWPFTFVAATDCLVPVPAGDPVFVDGVCDATHPGVGLLGTYTVILAEHVHYVASVNGSTPPTPLVVGVANQAQSGDVVVITPIADAGYVISPVIASEKLTHTFAVPGDCLVKADFVKPEATSQNCVVDGNNSTLVPAFITIPDTPHVQYFINDVLQTKAGDVTLPPGSYKVSAAAETGYFLQGYNGPWTEVLTSAEPCGDLITHPLVFPVATQVQMGCFTDGSYSLSNSINDAAALTWTVNGSTVSQGTYKVGAASTVVVHAAANGPAYGLETGATTDWTFHFVRPTSCDLTTLALTGSTPTGWLLSGYAMLVFGLALVALRFARRRDDQA